MESGHEKFAFNPSSRLQMVQDQFCMSFLHKPHINCPPVTRHYYAFTYPFSYTECQEQLAGFAELYQKTPHTVNYIIQRLMAPAAQKSHAVEVLQLPDDPPSPSRAALRQSERAIADRLAKMSRFELETEIYYHRELLVHSVHGRRVDLMTISAFNGIRLEREARLPDLFPEGPKTVRCNLFHGKPVIFVSSRVHPGETPASHVLNGFLKLLLDVHSLVGAALRKMYVFKIVPFLNPDGVYAGCYRSDTLGHNLNRVYQTPSLETQPSIYAVRKLVRFYHYNANLMEFVDSVADTKADGAANKEQLIAATTLSPAKDDQHPADGSRKPQADAGRFIVPPNPPSHPSCGSREFIVSDMQCNTDSSSTAHSSDSEGVGDARISSESCPSTTASDVNVPEALLRNAPAVVAADEDNVDDDDGALIFLSAAEAKKRSKTATRIFHDKLVPVIKPIVIEGAAGVYPRKPLWSKGETANKVNECASARPRNAPVVAAAKSMRSNSAAVSRQCCVTDSAVATLIPQQKPTPLISSSFRITKRRNTAGGNNDVTASNGNNNNDLTHNEDAVASKFDTGNLFLYIDMHGHASKKGIFMYGNHFPTTEEAVECMLLPRLMSMNCQHFHFDSCVFSERNMYSTCVFGGIDDGGRERELSGY